MNGTPHQNKQYDWKGKTILIAEDMESSNYYFEAALRKTNVNILWAVNGKQAVEKVENNKDIQAVLMDINMPEMNGLEATRKIRKIRNDLPVIVQTAYVLSHEEEKSYEFGANAFMSKPIKLNDLLETLDEFLSKPVATS